jgi:hypothetical protein
LRKLLRKGGSTTAEFGLPGSEGKGKAHRVGALGWTEVSGAGSVARDATQFTWSQMGDRCH